MMMIMMQKCFWSLLSNWIITESREGYQPLVDGGLDLLTVVEQLHDDAVLGRPNKKSVAIS